MSRVLVGVDIGTSSVKSLMMDLTGKVLGFAQAEYEIRIPHAGHAEQDPETWWLLVCSTIDQARRQAAIAPEDVIGIGLSGQMHGLVALDKDGSVLRPSIIWCDQRSTEQKDQLYSTFSEEQLGNMIQNPVATGFQLLSLMWLKENEPHTYNRISKVILPKDYVRFRMTGEISVEASDASSTSAFDVSLRKWSLPMLETIGIEPAIFPQVGEPWEIGGYMTQAAANDTGLRAGIPVVFGGADQPMQAIGNGIIHPGTISCTIGTGGQLFTPINRPIYDKQLRTHTFVHAVPDTWYLLGATMSAGLSLKWLANKILNNEDYKALDVKAGAVPAGSDHLIFLPYLTGDRTPHMDPHARAMFFGLTLGHNDAHMIRSVLEGVAYSLRDSLEIFKSLGVSAERVIISGGGARSKLWSQILADILNTDVHVSTTQEQACVGAALLAGVATKAYESIEDACSRVVTIKDTPIQPDSDNRALYDEHYNIYKELYERNNHLFPRL